MALAGSPDRHQEIDTAMAGAYLRLTEKPYKRSKQEELFTDLLSAKGFTPEQTPEGIRRWDMPVYRYNAATTGLQ